MSILQGRIVLEAGYLGRFSIIVLVCIENLLAGNDINLHDFICIFFLSSSSSASYVLNVLVVFIPVRDLTSLAGRVTDFCPGRVIQGSVCRRGALILDFRLV